MPNVTREELAEALRSIMDDYKPYDSATKKAYITACNLLSRLDAEQNGGES